MALATALPALWEGRTSGLGVGGGASEGLLGGGEDRAQPEALRGAALRALTGTGGGLLQDRDSYRKHFWGNSFRGLYSKIL